MADEWMTESDEIETAIDELGLRDLFERRERLTGKDVRAAFRRLAYRMHPDMGGDEEAFRRLNELKSVLIRAGTLKKRAINFKPFVRLG